MFNIPLSLTKEFSFEEQKGGQVKIKEGNLSGRTVDLSSSSQINKLKDIAASLNIGDKELFGLDVEKVDNDGRALNKKHVIRLSDLEDNQSVICDIKSISDFSNLKVVRFSQDMGMYICTHVIPDPESGGNLYRIELKEEFNKELSYDPLHMSPLDELDDLDELDEIDKQLFPAIQLLPGEIDFKGYKDKFEFLGYRKDNSVLILPDIQVLNDRWNKLRKIHSALPELTFISSQGISDDLSFIAAFLQNKLICSCPCGENA